jgi:uncharacterized protein (TIGR02145 family)
MMVYNSGTNLGGPSIYIWNGEQWTAIIAHSAPEITVPAYDATKITELEEPLTLSVTAKGYGLVPTYQWQQSDDGVDGWQDIQDATGADCDVPVNAGGKFHYRCTATNTFGTDISNVFTVIVCPQAVKDLEGNYYCTGDFGSAGTWMTMNLRSTRNESYTDLEENRNSNAESRKYYYYPKGDKALFEAHPEYGLHYTWPGANNIIPTDDDYTDENPTNRQGICPAGWHVPTNAEWTALIQVLNDDESQIYSSNAGKNNAGLKIRSKTRIGNEIRDPDFPGESHASYENRNGMDILLVGTSWAGDFTYWGQGVHVTSSSSYPGSPGDTYTVNLWDGSRNAGTVKYAKGGMPTVRCKRN